MPPEPVPVLAPAPDRRPFLLALLLVVLFVPGFFSRDAWNPDEPRYVEVARVMRVTGEWVLPHLNGRIYPEKPPLFFWLAAVAASATGSGVVGARIVSALAAAVAVLATVILGRRAFRDTPGAGVAAGAALATSVVFLTLSQQGVIDPLLTAATTVATAALLIAEETDARGRRAALTALGYAALVAGTLAKGPSGTLAPLVALGAAIGASRGFRAIPWRHFVVGPLLAGGVTIGWLYAASLRAGAQADWYWDRMLWSQTVDRFTGARDSHNHSPFYYFGSLAWGALPWVAFLPAAVAGALERRRSGDAGAAARIAVLAWLAAVFVLFSANTGKRVGYILPLYPALALLVGARFAALERGVERAGRLDRVPALVWGAALLALGPLVAAMPFVHAPAIEALAPRFADTVDVLRTDVPPRGAALACVAGAALSALGLLIVRATRAGAWMRVFGLLAAAVATASLGLHAVAYPALDRVKSFRGIGEAVVRRVPAGDRLVYYLQDHDNQLGAYTGALGYELFELNDRDHARLEEALRAPGTLWIVAGHEAWIPPRIARAIEVVESHRVGRRKMLLLKEVTDTR